MSHRDPSSLSHFEAMYRASADPWRFGSAPYEQQRYAVLLQMLAKANYCRALEPGCSIGAFTQMLAPRCEQLIAFDFSPTAIAAARTRCTALSHAQIFEANLATYQPEGSFDLIVLSELGYYFQPGTLYRIASRLAAALAPFGEFVACHWLGSSNDHVMHADEVHAILAESLVLTRIESRYRDGFRVDRWIREV